jgi:hypothetical protein
MTFEDAADIAAPVQLRPTRYVAEDLPEFTVKYRIDGELILRARTADDAYCAALLYTKEQLGRRGDLEMDDPVARQAARPRSGVLADLNDGREG